MLGLTKYTNEKHYSTCSGYLIFWAKTVFCFSSLPLKYITLWQIFNHIRKAFIFFNEYKNIVAPDFIIGISRSLTLAH